MSVLKFREPQTNEWKEITTIVGPAGKDGAPGADGKDYVLTDEDKAEIAAMVDVSGGNSCPITSGTGANSIMTPTATKAEGSGSVSIGDMAIAYGHNSIAMNGGVTGGNNTVAIGQGATTPIDTNASTAIGRGTQTGKVGQVAIGQYNSATDTSLTFIVGSGKDEYSRRNAMTVDGENQVHFPGSVVIGENKDEVATKAYVDSVSGGGGGGSSENCVFISAQPWLMYDEVPENEFAVAFWRELNDNGKIKTDTEVYFTDTSGNKFRVIDYQTESTGFYIKTAFNKDNIRYVKYYNMGDASSTAISGKGSVYTETAAASGKSWTYYSASATANCLIPEVSSPFMKIVGYWDSNTTNYVNYEIYHQNDGSLGNNNNTFKHYIYDPIKSKAYYFGYHLWMSPASYGISLYELDGTQVMGSQFHVVGYYLYS